MAHLVDTNVLIDVSVRDPVWSDWSRTAMVRSLDDGLVINPVIFAEFSYRFDRLDEAEQALGLIELVRVNLPWESAFIAGRAFRTYRMRGGARQATLPDFFIGAHALVSGLKIITRDPSGFQTYFPQVELITPETHP